MERYPPQKNVEKKYEYPLIFIRIKKIVIYLGIFTISLLLYNFDALIGYFRFRGLCKTEGGARYYEQAEKDVGWKVEYDGMPNPIAAFAFKHVAFIRYENEKGEKYDVTHIPPWSRPLLKENLAFNPIDESKEVRYFYHHFVDDSFEGDDRLHKTQRQVIDLKKNKIIFKYTSFWYEWSKADIFMLINGSGVSCHSLYSTDKYHTLFLNIFQPRSQ